MIVRTPFVRLVGTEARATATVESETGAFAPFELFFGVPRQLAGWLDVGGNAFVPCLLLLAGSLRERLRVAAPVSSRLLCHAPCANGLYTSWWGIAPVTVEAEAVPADRRPSGDGGGLFFTRGVDSWYSALRARDGVLPESITHLLYVPDFDKQFCPANRARAVKRTREAAAWLGLPLVAASTNARDLLDRFLSWEWTHGSVLASTGLALGGWLKALVVASSNATPDDRKPWGSTPQLDPLWSTEQTSVRVDGSDATRTEKVRHLAGYPEVVSRLKVCWLVDTDTNCGSCEKCLRTQCALAMAGAAGHTSPFERPLTTEALSRIRLAPMARAFWNEIAASWPPEPHLAALRTAVRALLAAPAGETGAPPAESATPVPAVLEVPPGCPISVAPPDVWQHLPRPAARQDLAQSPAEPCRFEITWAQPTPERRAFPLRPPAALRPAIIDACRMTQGRSVPWCVIDMVSPSSAELVVRLSGSWGPGIAALGRHARPDGDHGLTRSEAAEIQRRCRIRAWMGGADHLDPFRVLAALTHGCLPLQLVPEDGHDELAARLPEGLHSFLMPWPRTRPVPGLSLAAVAERLDAGLSVVLRGSLERDLARRVPEGVGCVLEAA
jgi:hypothetical protein